MQIAATLPPLRATVGWLISISALLVCLCGGCGGDSEAATALTEEEQAAAEAAARQPQGISLGTFDLRDYHATEGVRSRLYFELFASVQTVDVETFQSRLESRTNRVRDQVITAVRLATISEFNEAKLDWIRRRILLRLHRTLPELAIQDILISQFSHSLER